MFAIALSVLHLIQQFMGHIYFSEIPITRVFRILHIIRNR